MNDIFDINAKLPHLLNIKIYSPFTSVALPQESRVANEHHVSQGGVLDIENI